MIVVSTPDMTPTEHRMLQVLADGKGHAMSELHACLDDPLSGRDQVYDHISSLRTRIAKQRVAIVRYVENRNTRYRLIDINDD